MPFWIAKQPIWCVVCCKIRPTGKIAEVSADATVKELAQAMGIQPNLAQKRLVQMGELVAINAAAATRACGSSAEAYGYTLKMKTEPKESLPGRRSTQAQGAERVRKSGPRWLPS